MSEVAYDMLEKFPIPPKNKVWGEVSFIRRFKQAFFYNTINFEYSTYKKGVNQKHHVCLDILGAQWNQPIGVGGCHHGGGSQLFRINVEGEMSSDERCFHSDRDMVVSKFCLDYAGVWNPIGEWEYDEANMTIKSNKEKKCLSTDGKHLKLEECNMTSEEQKWKFNPVYY